MAFPATTSFTPLSTIHLPAPAQLYHDACNPAMDLVALLSNPSRSVVTSSPVRTLAKGKGKDAGDKVSLWRMSGGKVWEVAVDGDVHGLTWSRDGLYLSLLVSSGQTCVVEHFSVHTGALVRSVPLGESVDVMPCRLEWLDSGFEWPDHAPGSALMIIDSLPDVTPVDPPKPAIINPFMQAKLDKPSNRAHARLATFPVLLPAVPPAPPDLLCVQNTIRLLHGTFKVPNHPQMGQTALQLAQLSNKLAGLLDTVLRGLEAAEVAIKDGEKQTMIWREEVETCAEQQGMSKADVHADLFRLLMTGRSGAAVSEWLGNRMSNRWESALLAGIATTFKVITESVAPALERVILILEELSTWPRMTHLDLAVDTEQVGMALRVAQGTLEIVEDIREAASEELLSATEFFKWIKHEIARGAASADASDASTLVATYDLKRTWAFLVSGFVHSTMLVHFPVGVNVASDPPELVPPSAYTPTPALAPTSLDAALRETTDRLSAQPGADLFSPAQRSDGFAAARALPRAAADVSGDSMDMSRVDDVSFDDKENAAIESSDDGSGDDDDDDEADTAKHANDAEVEREREREPKLWANTLVAVCEQLVRSIAQVDAATPPTSPSTWDELMARGVHRRVAESLWLAIASPDKLVVLRRDGDTCAAVRWAHPPNAQCLAAAFFDDAELALVFATHDERVFGTTAYMALFDELAPADVPVEQLSAHVAGLPLVSPRTGNLRGWARLTAQAGILPLSRSRPLALAGDVALALNGRPGRRVACVLGDGGTEVAVFDMDTNEDEDENETEDGDGGGDDVDMA